MTQTVTVKDFREHLTEFLSKLSPDHDLVIQDGGRPIARIAAIKDDLPKAATAAKRESGFWTGQIETSADFDEPLPDSSCLNDSSTAIGPPKKPRPLGRFKGKIWIAPDFDAELPDEFWFPPDDPLSK